MLNNVSPQLYKTLHIISLFSSYYAEGVHLDAILCTFPQEVWYKPCTKPVYI